MWRGGTGMKSSAGIADSMRSFWHAAKRSPKLASMSTQEARRTRSTSTSTRRRTMRRFAWAALVAAVRFCRPQPAAGPAGPTRCQGREKAQGDAGHGTSRTSDTASPAMAAFKAANARMHRDMDIKLTGDVDADFVRGMIPHHQGAIDMAKVVVSYGKDPQIRKLAEEVIKAQEAEIAQMRQWLKDRGQ
jgi:hypothetical protein